MGLMVRLVGLSLLTVLACHPVTSTEDSLVAYDCSRTVNTTSYSLADTGGCKKPTGQDNGTKEIIQIVQYQSVKWIMTRSCRIEVTHHVTHCYRSWYVGNTDGGFETFIYELDRTKCERMHRTRRLDGFYDYTIDDLPMNGTLYGNMTLAGSVDQRGYCKGGNYLDRGGIWSSVVVQASVSITLAESMAAVNLETLELITPRGFKCDYAKGQCSDFDYSLVLWDLKDHKGRNHLDCTESSYSVLYQGPALKVRLEGIPENQIFYAVVSEGRSFAIPIDGEDTLCEKDIQAFSTSNPDIYIIELKHNWREPGKPWGTWPKPGKPYFNGVLQNGLALDLIAHVNAHLVFLQMTLANQLSSLYETIDYEKCLAEQQARLNLLALSAVDPDEFAYTFMKSPGYTAHRMGEIVHIQACDPVTVQLRLTSDKCYRNLPVVYDDVNMFVAPRTRILKDLSEDVPCDPQIPIGFKVNDDWVGVSPTSQKVVKPQELPEFKNLTSPIYTTLDLFSEGLYSAKYLADYRRDVQMTYRLNYDGHEEW